MILKALGNLQPELGEIKFRGRNHLLGVLRDNISPPKTKSPVDCHHLFSRVVLHRQSSASPVAL